MNTKQRITVICLLTLGLLIAGCGSGHITPDPSKGTVRGTTQNGTNIIVAIFPEVDGKFTLNMSDDIPQVQTDKNGNFELVNVEPGVYVLASPQSDGGFKLYSRPSNTKLIHSSVGYGALWTFQVNAGQSIDLGNLK